MIDCPQLSVISLSLDVISLLSEQLFSEFQSQVIWRLRLKSGQIQFSSFSLLQVKLFRIFFLSSSPRVQLKFAFVVLVRRNHISAPAFARYEAFWQLAISSLYLKKPLIIILIKSPIKELAKRTKSARRMILPLGLVSWFLIFYWRINTRSCSLE